MSISAPVSCSCDSHRHASIEYERELRSIRPAPLADKKNLMKDRLDTLKTSRVRQEKAIAQEKLRQAWLESDPDLRRYESSRMADYYVKQRQEQVCCLSADCVMHAYVYACVYMC